MKWKASSDPRGLSFLVLGGGSIGLRHLANLRALGVDDIAIFDPDVQRMEKARALHNAEPVSDLETAYAHAEVAIICSPTRFHGEQVRRAIENGCALFVEKPLSDTMDDVEAILATVERLGTPTLVGCNYRFHPGMVKAYELVNEGALGQVVSVRAQFGQYLPDWHPWEDYREGYSARRELGGGVLLDRIHEIDYVIWLFGRPSHVFGLLERRSHLDIDTEDTAEILMRLENGGVASIHTDYVRRSYDCQMEVVGDQGTLTWDFPTHSVTWYLAKEKQRTQWSWPSYELNEMYLDEMRHFLRVLAGREASMATVEQGALDLKVALAARTASEELKVVTL